jgi:hypothetical protein
LRLFNFSAQATLTPAAVYRNPKPGGSKPAAERGLDELKAEAIALAVAVVIELGVRARENLSALIAHN